MSHLFNSSGPNKGVGFNLNIPIRNRPAQALEARSQIKYRQAQMRLQQLYVQIRMQIVNDQYALTNDRAAVNAAIANQEYNHQSLDAENKKLHLGASTTANVLVQQKGLAAADAQLISARPLRYGPCCAGRGSGQHPGSLRHLHRRCGHRSGQHGACHPWNRAGEEPARGDSSQPAAGTAAAGAESNSATGCSHATATAAAAAIQPATLGPVISMIPARRPAPRGPF